MLCNIKLLNFTVRAKQELHMGSFAAVYFRTGYIKNLNGLFV